MRYQNLVDEMVEKSKSIFKESLTGIYLHGSLAIDRKSTRLNSSHA